MLLLILPEEQNGSAKGTQEEKQLGENFAFLVISISYVF